MRRFNLLTVSILSVLGGAGLALADIKVDKQPIGPDGESLGCSISPHGGHVAVLAAKGSRFVVLIDGVEGPRIDALLNDVCGHAFQTGSYWSGQVPVLFSNDGNHNAYIAKMGNEYVVMLDGKELARGAIVTVGQANSFPLEFSAGGKHLFYMDVDSAGKYRIVVDGKPGPGSQYPPQPVISNDGAHYAYLGFDHNGNTPNWAVVDGRQVNYFGDNLQYTGRNVLVSKKNDNGTNTLLLNGKPEIKAMGLQPMWMSPDGAQIAVVITPRIGVPTFLTVNGKTVPGTEGLIVEDVFFSADGKRYAARCDTKTGAKFMIIDGKKGEEYQDIPHQAPWNGNVHYTFVTGMQVTNLETVRLPVPGFTADSSKFVYIAVQGSRQFLVVEDKESNGFQLGLEPILSQAGHRIGAVGIAPNGKQHVIIDDQDKEYGPVSGPGGPMRIHDLTFTPDGSRFAFVNGMNLCVDWVAMPGSMNGTQYTFSPDNKHVVYLANDAGAQRLFMDGKIVESNPGNVPHAFFSPDSQHVCWLRSGNLMAQGTRDSLMLCVDGKMATHFSESGVGAATAVNFEFSPDGVVTFMARTDETMRLFHVTPAADGNVSAVLAAGQTPKDK